MHEIDDIPPLPRTPLILEHGGGDEPDEAAIDSLIEQYGTENRAVLKFYRVKKGEPDELLEELHPADFNFIHLARKYGRGRYRMKLFAPDPTRGGRLVQRMNREEGYGGEVDVPAIAAPVVAQQPGGDAVERLAAVMVSGFQELGKLIVQNQPKPATMSDMLQNMVLMRQAMGMDHPPAAEPGMDKMLGLLQQGIELGKDLAGNGGDGEGSFMKVAEKTLPTIAELVGKAMERQPTQPSVHVPLPPARPPVPRPAPLAAPGQSAPSLHPVADGITPPGAYQPNPQPIAQPQENPEMFGMNIYTPFKPYISQMADIFARNPDTDPTAYAVVVLDNIGDAELQFMLNDDLLIDHLAQVEPRITQQRQLWVVLLDTLRELTSPEIEGTTQPHVPEQAPTNPNEPGKAD